jgi:hypothetical protein
MSGKQLEGFPLPDLKALYAALKDLADESATRTKDKKHAPRFSDVHMTDVEDARLRLRQKFPTIGEIFPLLPMEPYPSSSSMTSAVKRERLIRISNSARCAATKVDSLITLGKSMELRSKGQCLAQFGPPGEVPYAHAVRAVFCLPKEVAKTGLIQKNLARLGLTKPENVLASMNTNGNTAGMVALTELQKWWKRWGFPAIAWIVSCIANEQEGLLIKVLGTTASCKSTRIVGIPNVARSLVAEYLGVGATHVELNAYLASYLTNFAQLCKDAETAAAFVTRTKKSGAAGGAGGPDK